jgi:16S rRNA (uracil1498-N3)-methyltransferase
VKVCLVEELPALRTPPVTLLLGLSRSNSVEQTIQDTVELGVHRIIIFSAQRSNVKIEDRKRPDRLARLERIAVSALQQSGFHGLPSIEFVGDIKTALLLVPGAEIRALLSTGLGLPSLASLIITNSKLSGQRAENKQLLPGLQSSSENAECSLIVGPEGGLTAGEESLAQEFGYHAVSLGVKTLRAETAATVAVALASLLRQ